MAPERKHEIGRRSFLRSAASLAATPLPGGAATQALAQAAREGVKGSQTRRT